MQWWRHLLEPVHAAAGLTTLSHAADMTQLESSWQIHVQIGLQPPCQPPFWPRQQWQHLLELPIAAAVPSSLPRTADISRFKSQEQICA